MKRVKNALMALAVMLALASGAWAQMGRGRMGMGPQAPPMAGQFKPVVGAGAQYTMTTKDGKTVDFTQVIVGKESVEGGDGYWMEQRFESPEAGGEMVMKQLVVMTNGSMGIKRMIMQPPGGQPMEFPASMMGRMGQGQHAPSPRDTDPGQMIGSESVTVPAGTFQCDHYRKQTERGTMDYWISMQVSPFPVVKMASSDMTMVLKKALSDETSHITGEPQQMPGMQRPH